MGLQNKKEGHLSNDLPIGVTQKTNFMNGKVSLKKNTNKLYGEIFLKSYPFLQIFTFLLV